jgi:hypothetical protein
MVLRTIMRDTIGARTGGRKHVPLPRVSGARFWYP